MWDLQGTTVGLSLLERFTAKDISTVIRVFDNSMASQSIFTNFCPRIDYETKTHFMSLYLLQGHTINYPG